MGQPETVGSLVEKRLRELERTAAELAEAVHVPTEYMEDLITGRRRPPMPGRTDVYPRMTTFLKLGRKELTDLATSERSAAPPSENSEPKLDVRNMLMSICEPDTARELERRSERDGNAELTGLFQRMLKLAQSATRSLLNDAAILRVQARRNGSTYADMRLSVLDFLDSTPDSLTVEHVTRFLKPRIRLWDVDLGTGVLRVVLQSQDPQARPRNR